MGIWPFSSFLAPPSPLLRLRPRPTVDMVDMVATVAMVDMVDMVAMVDTVARERLRPRLLLLLSPRLMLRPTGLDMVDTAEAMVAMVVSERLRLPDTMVDMLVMEAMAATVATEDMVATVARGRLRLPDTTVDMLDMAATAAMVAMEDMAATVARGRLRLPDTMVDM